MYRDEIEYLLWGKDSVTENVKLTNATIFGTRFVLNFLYCLSSRDISLITRPAAIAIAGWLGFGVPIVKTVLDLAIALAETVIDMNDLLDGQSVALYKSRDIPDAKCVHTYPDRSSCIGQDCNREFSCK